MYSRAGGPPPDPAQRGTVLEITHWILTAVLLAASPQEALAETQEYPAKALCLYNFAKYIEWPASSPLADPSNPITIGILGRDPFGPVLDEVTRGRTAHNRAIVVRRYERVADVRNCHILFIGSSESRHVAAALESGRLAATFTVGEIEGFTSVGGMAEFQLEAGKIRFAINSEAASNAGIRISSQLLKLARNAKGGARKLE